MVQSSLRRSLALAAVALMPTLTAPGIAHAQDPVQSFFANRGLPGAFWADEEPHTIVSLSQPARYQICNLMHTTQQDRRPLLEVNADGNVLQIHQGRCTDVEAAVITVSVPDYGPAAGQYRALD
jgi:hypothetical protein